MPNEDDQINLSKFKVEQPWLIEEEVKRILSKPKQEQVQIVNQVLKDFKTKSDDTRWIIGIMIEYFLEYDPCLIPRQIILDMASDRSFSVRSSAAYCFYTLSNISPSEVPLDILSKLAAVGEDWYVCTPARAALKVLSHKRSAAVRIILDMISSKNVAEVEVGVSVLLDIVRNDRGVVDLETLKKLEKHCTGFQGDIGREIAMSFHQIVWTIQSKEPESKVIRYSPL
jgi:hypothetical protein